MKAVNYRIVFTLSIGIIWVCWALARYGGPAYLNNITATGAPDEVTCSACHAGGTGSATLQLEVVQGPARYQPGANYLLRATVQGSGSQVAGLQAVVLEGDTSPGQLTAGAGLRTLQSNSFSGTPRRYVEHTSPQATNAQGTTSWTFSWQAPQTPGLSPVIYAAAVAANNDFSPNGDQVALAFLSLTSLPVTWGDFRLEASPQGLEVQWETLAESGNEGFQVERSLDGHLFTRLAFVPGIGNSEQKQAYAWVDHDPMYGVPLYYRIRQIDINGASSLSKTQSISLPPSPDKLVGVFPNQLSAGEDFFVRYQSLEPGTVRISIQSITGVRIRHRDFSLAGGTENLRMSTVGLKPGMYVVGAEKGDQYEIGRLFLR